MNRGDGHGQARGASAASATRLPVEPGDRSDTTATRTVTAIRTVA
jgi:hypothetical protein